MDYLISLLILYCYGYGESIAETTKYLNSCSDVGGKNSFFTMDENTGVGYVMYNISNIDNSLFYVSPGAPVSTTINNSYGLIRLIESLDYENHTLYSYSLVCKYKYDMSIIVRNIIEGRLSFQKSTYTASTLSIKTVGSVVIPSIRILYTDADPSDIRFNMTESEFFLSYIRPGIFQLQQRKRLVNSVYKFYLTVYLEGFPENNDTASIVINVIDNDLSNVSGSCKEAIYIDLTIVFAISTGILLLLHAIEIRCLYRLYQVKRTKKTNKFTTKQIFV
ncbi:unnamed protein product [Mytilus edulis]|uniref:Cadherin domain-containing protein n=1 Tax=Mytilus edulis TaxID=6550 RepID=A0A8S3RM22_MYTED|nr:unnamed protein product [Mytilus edulis]